MVVSHTQVGLYLGMSLHIMFILCGLIMWLIVFYMLLIASSGRNFYLFILLCHVAYYMYIKIINIIVLS